MDIPSNSFKIRKSFNMINSSPQVPKTSTCPFYGKHGFCNNTHNLTHQDCKNYFKYQYCFQKLVNKCPYFHREVCSNWKKNGKCPIPECEFLHKNCENFQNYKICKRVECPFFHCVNQEKMKSNSNVFVRKSSNIRVTPKQDKSQNGIKLIKKPSTTQIQSEKQLRNVEEEEQNLTNPPKTPKRLMTFNQNISFSIHPIMEIQPAIREPEMSPEIESEDESKKSDHDSELSDARNEEEEKKAEIFHEEEKYQRSSPAVIRRKNDIINNQRKPEYSSNSNLAAVNENRYPRVESLSRRMDLIRNSSENPAPRNNRNTIERHGNLTIISLNNVNNNNDSEEVSHFAEGTIGHTLDRLNQFSQHLRTIRDSLQNQEGDLSFLQSRFRSLLQMQDRLNFVRRQERIIGNLDSLIETFLLINAVSGQTQSIGLRLDEFEQIPIYLFGIDDHLKNVDQNYEDSSTRKMCAVCLEDYKRNDLVRRLYCSHQYHEECLREWTKKKINCPVCKKDIRDGLQNNRS